MDLTTKQVKMIPNKTGVGGFKEHPENRNNGGRYPRSESFTYWFNVFKGLSVKEFKEWEDNNPESERSVVSDLAYTRMRKAWGDLRAFQDIANRSEGMPIHTAVIEEDKIGGLEVRVVRNVEDIKRLKELERLEEMYGHLG
jgi:hypothetical protein